MASEQRSSAVDPSMSPRESAPAGPPPGLSLSATKAWWRREVKARLAVMSRDERQEQSCRLVEMVQAHPEWTAARRVMVYSPLPTEVDLRGIWKMPTSAAGGEKDWIFPRVESDGRLSLWTVRDPESDLVAGVHGLMEPSPLAAEAFTGRPDIVLVPGLAFDDLAHRLGRGGGFYDRLIAAWRDLPGPHESPVRFWGICFVQQYIPCVPCEAHDQAVDVVFALSSF